LQEKIFSRLPPFPHNGRINLGALPMDSPRSRLPLPLAIFLTFPCPLFPASISAGKAGVPTIEVCFPPSGRAAGSIVRERDHADRQIPDRAFSFPSVPIAKASVDATNRADNDHYRIDVLHEGGATASRGMDGRAG